ncbi:MAG TPA: FecR domain-containing protein [Candidatus Polarisedimenticolia bacterium]|nr:FecR domain-containing protein [Candidatus Polarisedimenticolia bacterium]
MTREAWLLLAAACLAAATTGEALAADVGQAVLVRNRVTGAMPGAAGKALAPGDGIGLGLEVATAEASGIRMTFAPQGSLTLGASTRLAIEQSVVDQATGRGTSTVSLGIGTLRVALGSLFGGQVDVKTPSAVVGIKGTVVMITVDADGGTTVLSLEGTASARSASGGASVDVTEGSYVVIPAGGAPGAPVPLDAPAAAPPPGLTADPMPPPAPDPFVPDSRMAASAFGPGGAAPGKGGGRLPPGTNSPAAGGAAFTDPRAAAPFLVAPLVVGRGGQCNPTGQGC